MSARRRVGTRDGFSLVELLVALVLTTIIGTSLTLLFVTQGRFLEQQQKQEFARGVTRSATNIMMSELRMIDRDAGVIAASPTSITVRAPFAMGVVCKYVGSLVHFALLPVDSILYNLPAATGGGMNGFAHLTSTGSYQYTASTTAPAVASNAECAAPAPAINPPTGSVYRTVNAAGLAPAPRRGAPIMLYRNVRYHFANSTAIPGRLGLYREVGATNEEIVAPFDASAGFAFFVNDALTAQTTAPTDLTTLTGFEIRLNSVSERPNADGTFTIVPMTTGVFFKNRRN